MATTTHTPIDETIIDQLAITCEQRMERHGELLQDITKRALRSPVYSGRFESTASLGSLSSVPLTSYEHILECTEKEGLDKILLCPVQQSFHTSGSTGKPKRFHYGREDIDRIVSEYAMVSRVMGVQTGQKGWNLGGRLPDVSGFVLEEVSKHLGMNDAVTTLLKDDKDLIKALQRISSERNVRILACPALILYLIGRMSHEPTFLSGLIEDKAMRSYHLPRPLAKLARKIYLRGIDLEVIKDIAENATLAISYAEALTPYRAELSRCYPRLKIFDVYGSTENPIMAAQLDQSVEGLCMINNTIIPEIAPPDEVLRAKSNGGHVLKAVGWPDWKAGMIGELMVTRPGQCLPLVRYPTGDIIQVIDPAHEVRMPVNGESIVFDLPLIRVLGRSVETMDFDAHDESGNFLGVKVYSRYVTEALHRSSKVMWWELYNIKGTPGRLAMVIIPESDPTDLRRFRNDVRRRLTAEDSDIPHPFQIASDLGRLEIIVLPSAAYTDIQAEIDRRVREGRSYGQLKPKHIYVMKGEEEFEGTLRAKFSRFPPLARDRAAGPAK